MFKISILVSFIFVSTLSFGQTRIPIDSAMYHIGDRVSICSKVYGVKALDKVTFINLGSAFPNSPLTVVIFAKDINGFSDSPVNLYSDKSICVTGVIKEYKGKVEIIVSKQDEIIVE